MSPEPDFKTIFKYLKDRKQKGPIISDSLVTFGQTL